MLNVETMGDKVMSERGMTYYTALTAHIIIRETGSIPYFFLSIPISNIRRRPSLNMAMTGKETSTFLLQVSYPSLSALKPVKTVATFKYDRHPNPWNLLVKQAGVILPTVLEGHNISKNNMIEKDLEVIFPDDTANLQLSKAYTYNSAGYPVEEITPGLQPDTIFYHYR